MKRVWTWTRGRFFQDGQRPHSPSFDTVSVHHILTASLSGYTDLARCTRTLLDADVAVSAAWPSETAVRVPYRHRKMARLIRKSRSSVAMLEAATASDSWRAAFAFAQRHPRLGIRYLRAKWLSTKVAPRVAELAETESLTSLAKLFFLHPIFTMRHILPYIRLTRGNTNRIEWDRPSTPSDHEQPISMPGGESDPDDVDTLKVLAEAESILLNRQVVSAAIRRKDVYLFGGPSHDDDGFVRLMLRESYHDFVLPGSD